MKRTSVINKKSALALSCALFCCNLWAAPPEDATENIVIVEVNGRQVSDTLIILQSSDGDVWIEPAELEKFQIVLPAHDDPNTPASVRSFGIEPEYNAATQSINLKVPAAMLPSQSLNNRSSFSGEAEPSPKGVFINYDVVQSINNGELGSTSVGHDLRSAVLGGALYSTGQLNHTNGQTQYIRGLSTWNKDFVDSKTVLQFGDVFTRSGSFSSAVNLMGVRFATDRDLSPNAIFYPVPVIGGIAETRSTTELYLNQSRSIQSEIVPGPYMFEDYPVLQGANQVRLVVRDEFGREQVIQNSFYLSTENIKKGALEYDVSIGARRISGNNYTGRAGSAHFLYGVNNSWTTGSTIQTDGENYSVSSLNSIVLGRFGYLGLDLGQSKGPEGKGRSYSWGYEYNQSRWSFRANQSYFADNQWSLGRNAIIDRPIDNVLPQPVDPTLPIPPVVGVPIDENPVSELKRNTSAGFGLTSSSGKWSASFNYIDLQFSDDRSQKLFGATATFNHGNHSFNLGGNYDPSGEMSAINAVWRYSWRPRNITTSASMRSSTRNDVRTTNYAATVSGRSDWRDQTFRWGLGTTQGDRSDIRGDLFAEFSRARVGLRGSHSSDSWNVVGQIESSVWLGEGGITFQGPSFSSFAVVEVPGQANVPVSVGSVVPVRTNKRGFAVVSGVQPLVNQTISIDSEDIPLDVNITNTRRNVVVDRLSGGRVTFDVTTDTLREVLVTLNGVPVEMPAKIETSTETVAIGIGGVSLLENPQPNQKAVITYGEGVCHAVLPDVIPSFEEIIKLECVP